WRRKRVGWMLTLIVLIISIPTHLLKGLDYEEASLAAILAGILIYLRPYFHARSDTPSIQQGLRILAAALLFTIAYGVIGFYLLDKHFRFTFGLWAAFRQTIVMFTQFYDPGLEPISGFGRYFADSIYVVGFITLGYALLMLLRPVLNRHPATEDERSRAWEIVKANGRTALARYALLDDKKFFFGSNGSLISYVVENRVALTLGDPIGLVDDVKSVVAEFQDLCKFNDWLPAFYQVGTSNADVYKDAGFDMLPLGQDAIVNLSDFTLDGSENKTLRNSYNKMVRVGYHYDVLQPPYSTRMLRELNTISDEWLSNRGMSEMRFSLGWFDEAYLNTCPILLVRDREGFIEAFANIVTEFQGNEVAVDLMRHRNQVESGLMDFLFVSLFQWANENGYASFNLGLSALSGVGERSDDPAIERTLNYIYRNVSRFYNFRGLHTFKEKFHPTWSPRYLTYPNAVSLPAISVALYRANMGRSGIYS
ncbi:MAG TPA: phosphatidylglycerol lysyltransferase domain-containing protein, partial [Anaerolineales bacterium]|nr:phosphatidylglycerol lysyltransferase domain-containing protein [Anaerolineales bacterium]